MSIVYFKDVEQGSGDWAKLRLGILTASEMNLIITPTLKIASNEKERGHLYDLLAQRVTQYIEPHFVSFAMERGEFEETAARDLYSEKCAAVEQCGFIRNDDHGFVLGYSPDGLVGDDGLIEVKSRNQKYQMQTIVEDVLPPEFMLQIQTGLLVSQRKWCDFLSYSGGMPMFEKRIFPDEEVHSAIIDAASAFEKRLQDKLQTYNIAAKKYHNTPRVDYQEISA